jgi:hypothetical protein
VSRGASEDAHLGERLRAEATRLYLRYAAEVVERFHLCPWAADARAAGRVQVCVLVEAGDPLRASAEALEALASQEAVDIALLVLPTFEIGRTAFERFVAGLREQHAAQHALGQAPFALADFHPDAPLDAASPERLVPFFRRTPDPTVQAVRRRRLDEVRRGADHGTELLDPQHLRLLASGDLEAWARRPAPLHTRVIQANHRTLTRHGPEAICAVLDDIMADRARSYAALGLP